MSIVESQGTGEFVMTEVLFKHVQNPVLRFTPYAWAKMIFLRDISGNEVGGFGITYPDNPLVVEDVILPKQEVSAASVDFDDEGVADYFERMLEYNLQPKDCGRIWIHTHPSGINNPSGTDEHTFNDVFGKCDWAIMFILTKGGTTYCSLQHNTFPACRINIEAKVDFGLPFGQSRREEWAEEYAMMVKNKVFKVQTYSPSTALVVKNRFSREEIDDDLYFLGGTKEEYLGYPGYGLYGED